MTTAQEFKLVDVMKLEVAAPADGLTNLIQNPSGELGGWQWVTPVDNTLITTGAGPRLRFATTVTQASRFVTEALGMAAGDYVGARFEVLARSAGTVTVRARFVFLDASGATISSSAQTAAQGVGVVQLAGAQAPVGTVRVQLRVDVYTSGGNLAAGAWVEWHEAVLATAPTSGDLGGSRFNLFTNPSWETDTAQALAVGGNTLSRVANGYVGTYSLAITRTGANGTVGAYLPGLPTFMAVQSGREYAVQARVRLGAGQAPNVVRLSPHQSGSPGELFEVLATDAGWSLVSGIVTTDDNNLRLFVNMDNNQPTGTVLYVDAVMVELASEVGSYFDGDTADGGGIAYDWTGTAHASTSVAIEAGSLPFIPPQEWLSILGSSNRLTLNRAELSASELTALVLSTSLDPATSDAIRPGRPCRVSVHDGAEFTPIFTGKVLNARVTYHPLEPDLEKRTRIELNAVDPAADLANVKRAEGVATIDELPAVLEGAGVPWNVNGSGDQVVATVVATNDNASALDQVVLTRDSSLGYAWVDRRGVLTAYDAAELPTVEVDELSEVDYSAIAIDFDTDRCINVVSVTFLRTNPATGESEEVAYGPYVDQASVDEWGAHSATFTIQWADEDPAAIEAYADAILLANATPAVRVNSVTVPVRTLARAALTVIDLLDLVAVVNVASGIDEQLRIRGIRHTMTGDLWSVTYDFAGEGRTATPTYTPSPSGGANGKTLSQLLRPVGEVTQWFGAKVDCPGGWLVLDGAAFDPATYPDLFELLGDDVLPDFTDRFPIGAGTKALGAAGGAPTKVLTEANLPPHEHGGGSYGANSAGNHFHTTQRRVNVGASTGAAQGGGALSADGQTTTTTDGAHTHNVTGQSGVGAGTSTPVDILNPWRALWFIIRAK